MKIPTPTRSEVLFIRKHLFRYSDILYDSYLWRSTKNKYHALVAEIMLQRTKADQVLPVFIHFTKNYKTPEEFLRKNKENVFSKLGLPARYISLRKLSEILSGVKDIPEKKEDLLNLPGIGDYVASAYRSLHLEKRDVLIDSNIVRFYSRFFGFPSGPETRRSPNFKILAEKITPSVNNKKFNYSLLDFTRKICKPKKPSCDICYIRARCRSGVSR